MENSIASKIISKITVAIFAVAVVDLIFINWWILQKSTILSEWQNLNIKDNKLEAEQKIELTNPSPTPEIASPSPTPTSSGSGSTSSPQTIVEKQTQTVVQTANKEIFIPMGDGSSSSDKYADLNGTDVTIDTAKYSAIDSVTFEASVWVEGGNGRAYAQLYNVDDKNPYIESVISSNVSTPTVKSSGNIPLPSGRKTYKVQAKTEIVQFPAHVENARIKITLK